MGRESDSHKGTQRGCQGRAGGGTHGCQACTKCLVGIDSWCRRAQRRQAQSPICHHFIGEETGITRPLAQVSEPEFEHRRPSARALDRMTTLLENKNSPGPHCEGLGCPSPLLPAA